MKVKVCGIKYVDNLALLSELPIDMIGYNFYKPSSRYVGHTPALAQMALPKSTQKVGVFVNASLQEMKEARKLYNLDYLQLHGGETVEMAKKSQAIAPIIKVFSVDQDFDFSMVDEFGFADLFLFDTYSKAYGGSGKKFDWQLLAKYTGDTAFLLAGGIGPMDSQQLEAIAHPRLLGLDINSGFETAPGLKDVGLIKIFLEEIKN